MQKTKINIRGIILVALFSLLATFIARLHFFENIGISPLIIGIIIGIIYANTIRHKVPASLTPGVIFCTKFILRLGIIFYGFRLTFQSIEAVGLSGILASFLMVVCTFTIGYFVGVKVLKLDRDITILTTAGSSICGAAAILATEPIIKAEPYKSAIAVSTVVVFGTIAIFLYPFMYRMGIIPFNAQDMGIYIGASVHEVAHVVAASNAIGPEASASAVIVKMIRVMMLAPFLIILSWFIARSATNKGGEKGKITIPWFAVIFILVVGLNSFSWFSPKILEFIKIFDTFALTMAMCALGMETSFSKFKGVGAKPIYLATILFAWLIVGGFFIVKLSLLV